MHSTLTNYPGRKAADGQWQKILSEIPKCKTFVEVFAGSAYLSSLVIETGCQVVVNDIDRSCIDKLVYTAAEKVTTMCTDFSQVFNKYRNEPETVFYCDPPYKMETRSHKGKLYKYDWIDQVHGRFLDFVTRVKRPVIISHYPCIQYDKTLKKWRKLTYRAMTRAGVRDECLYMNFPAPVLLQCYKHVGANFTDRQRIKRKVERAIAGLNKEQQHERAAILSAIIDHFDYVTR